MVSTYFALLAEFGTGQIELERAAPKYFGVSDEREIKRRAAAQRFPVKVFRTGSQKSPWLVSAADLADHIDRAREEAQKNKSAVS